MSEYWINDSGDVMYADGDIGDYNHERYVIEQVLNSIASDLGVNADDLDDMDSVLEKFADEEGLSVDDDGFMRLVHERLGKDAQEQIQIARGMGDGREYAMRKWGWKRVANNSVESWHLTPEDLRIIADGLLDIAYEEGLEEDEVLDREYDISVYTSNKRYEVTIRDMLDGRVGERADFGDGAKVAKAQLDKVDKESMPDFYKGKLGDSLLQTVGRFDLT